MLRTLHKSDLDQLMAIENAVHISPWTYETFNSCFRAGYLGWVVEVDKKIVGFIFASIRTDECHILNICVQHTCQKMGYGQALLEKVLSYAKQKGVGVAYLEVRRSNLRAIQLYRKLHFHLIGERKDYYPSGTGREDALIFAKTLQPNFP